MLPVDEREGTAPLTLAVGEWDPLPVAVLLPVGVIEAVDDAATDPTVAEGVAVPLAVGDADKPTAPPLPLLLLVLEEVGVMEAVGVADGVEVAT